MTVDEQIGVEATAPVETPALAPVSNATSVEYHFMGHLISTLEECFKKLGIEADALFAELRAKL